MKKTVTINISGIVYHIDEDAYQVLQGYLLTLENHFKNESSSDEIMADIEARISELLQMKIKNPYQVISIADVHEIIKIMGTPEDFGIHSDQTNEQASNHAQRNDFKHLYRDDDNRVLGGVCSGIAYYFNVDVVLIRILFVISFFFAGPLLYIIAWIIIPKAKTTKEKVEMRGEKIDVESIKQRFKDGFEDVKKDTSSFVQNMCRNNKASTFFVQIGGYMFRAVFTVTILICIAVFLALFAGFSFQWIDFSNFIQIFPQAVQTSVNTIFSTPAQTNLAFFGLLLLFCLPILLLLWGMLSLLLGIKRNNKFWGYVVFVVWFSGVCMFGISAYYVVKDFKHKGIVHQTYVSKVNPENEFIITQSGFEHNTVCNFIPNDVKQVKDWAFVECVEQLTCVCVVDLQVKHSLQDSVTVEVFASSRGETNNNAMLRAQQIIISPKLTDSTLNISKYVALEKNQQWRKQKIQVIVTLPENLTCKIVEQGALKE